jgi:glutamine amidotransferase
MLPGIESDARFPTRRFRRIGETDSEHAFCALLERMAPAWENGVPSLDVRLAVISTFAEELRALGPANFVYSDGEAIFAHGHRRMSATGEIRPPGLHLLCRSCSESSDAAELTDRSLSPEDQEVALLASVPLTDERWEPLGDGEIVVLREGRLVKRHTHGVVAAAARSLPLSA